MENDLNLQDGFIMYDEQTEVWTFAFKKKEQFENVQSAFVDMLKEETDEKMRLIYERAIHKIQHLLDNWSTERTNYQSN